VPGFIDDPHPAVSDQFEDLIGSQTLWHILRHRGASGESSIERSDGIAGSLKAVFLAESTRYKATWTEAGRGV
jgi:hypothetical protein